MSQDGPRFPATVVKVLEADKLVINRGTVDEVRLGQRFVVYELEEEPIVDPETGESLGQLEIPKGQGTVTHVQEHMAMIYHGASVFQNPKVGDRAKPI